jgi:hypothetical protein
VLVDLLSSTSLYTANLIDVHGGVAASFRLSRRTPISTAAGHAIELPYISTTSTTLYMLSGDSQILAFRFPDQQRVAATLPVTSGTEAAFSVSPDDRTIAFTVLDFNRTPVRVSLYTEVLAGGQPQLIFQSDSDYVWPVAWHAGLVVLAHAYGPYEEDVIKAAPGRDNPYSAISYHLVDPVTGVRKVLMGACTVSGPLSPAGSACIQGGSIDWQGNVTPWGSNNWGSISAAASLSSDGRLIATVSPQDTSGLYFWSPDGTSVGYATGLGQRGWVGWLDDSVITGSYLDASWQPVVITVIDGVKYPVAGLHGFFAALFPTDLV